MLSWQVEKSSPQISPDFSHRRCQISNRIPNQISPKISQTHFCRLGSPNLFACKNGRFASSFLLLGVGLLEASQKANLSFKSPSPKTHLNRTGSVFALPIRSLLKSRYRPKGVFGKGVGNSQNASEMRQKYVKMGLVLLGKEERSKMRQKCAKIASKMRQKCAEHLWGRTPFGRYRKRGVSFFFQVIDRKLSFIFLILGPLGGGGPKSSFARRVLC